LKVFLHFLDLHMTRAYKFQPLHLNFRCSMYLTRLVRGLVDQRGAKGVLGVLADLAVRWAWQRNFGKVKALWTTPCSSPFADCLQTWQNPAAQAVV
jgi:hypothetical protein